MITYEILEFESLEGTERFIVVTNENETKTSFAAENENPNYISFLRQLSEENPNDPHFVAWVEAGNNPEEFWTQEEI